MENCYWWLSMLMILFFSDLNYLTCQFAADMKAKFEMPMLGKLSYFLGLEIA